MNAEFRVEEAAEGLLVGVGSFAGVGSEKSKRSFTFDPAEGFDGAAALGGLKSRLSKPREMVLVFGARGF